MFRLLVLFSFVMVPGLALAAETAEQKVARLERELAAKQEMIDLLQSELLASKRGDCDRTLVKPGSRAVKVIDDDGVERIYIGGRGRH